MTSEALITTVALPPALMPRSSTASLVMEDVTICPPPISTRIWEVVAPFLTSTTVPLIWLRALMRMAVLTMLGRARQRHAPLTGGEIKSRDRHPRDFARAYGAAKPDTSAFSSRMKSPCAAALYCFAFGAARIWRQAAGNCASVIGGLGFGGTFGGLGWIIESLNQKARSPALQP